MDLTKQPKPLARPRPPPPPPSYPCPSPTQTEINSTLKKISTHQNTPQEIPYILHLAQIYRKKLKSLDQSRLQYLSAVEKCRKYKNLAGKELKGLKDVKL